MGHRNRLLGISIFLMLAVPFIAVGVETNGTVFLGGRYIAQPEDDSGFNAFDVTRVYLTVKGSLPEKEGGKFKAGYRVTMDVKRIKNADDPLNGYFGGVLKYAYAELTHVSTGVKLRLGQHAVPWVGYSDKLLGIRYVTKSFPDTVKKLSSTDMGLSALFKLPSGYGDAQISVVNGEGWHKPESNKYKDFMGRLSIRPLPNDSTLKGLMAHVYYGYGIPKEGEVRNRLVTAVSYKLNSVTVLGEYLGSWDGDSNEPKTGAGFAGSVVLNLGALMGKGKHGVFAKVEKFDPNTDVEDDGGLRILAGVYCETAKGLKFALSYEAKSYEAEDKDTGGAIALHTQIKF